ncbi:hypothetical protein C8J56DRAFT_981893 [Mycena floridula]|nr:hypothetical protein C8J56DRAFT_981893 [Mycena floridula]
MGYSLLWMSLRTSSILLFFCITVFAANRTIDDTLGDSVTGIRPVYVPSVGVWEDATCAGCLIQPDRALAFDGTWTACTTNPGIPLASAELSFKGTAIYVFFILVNDPPPDVTAGTESNFTLDGTMSGKFVHQPIAGLGFQYNQLVFSAENLPYADHKLLIGTAAQDHNVFVNFDYAIYSVPDPVIVSSSSSSDSSSAITTSSSTTSSSTTSMPSTTIFAATNSLASSSASLTSSISPADAKSSPLSSAAASSSKTSSGLIAGVAVGAVGVVALLVGLFLCFRRHRRQRGASPMLDNEFPAPMMSAEAYLINPYPSTTNLDQRAPTISEFSQSSTTRRSIEYPRSEYPRSEFPSSASVRSPGTGHQLTRSPTSNTSISGSSTSPHMSMSMAYGGLALPPESSSRTAIGSGASAAELRQARQLELEDQMQQIQREMNDLQHEAAGRRASSIQTRPQKIRDEEEYELRSLRAQISQMKSQMEGLQEQAESPWAQGLSSEPPPGYTPRPVSVTV